MRVDQIYMVSVNGLKVGAFSNLKMVHGQLMEYMPAFATKYNDFLQLFKERKKFDYICESVNDECDNVAIVEMVRTNTRIVQPTDINQAAH